MRNANERNWGWALGALLVLGGCGGGAGDGGAEPTTPAASAGAEQPAAEEPAATEASPEEASPEAGEPTASAEQAPWQAGPLEPSEAPEPLLAAWERADNAQMCLPMVPAGEVLPRGRARLTEVDGGWAVAFDLPGKPGLRDGGRRCRRCGRSAVGLAGTSMAPEELEEAEGVERLADGSLLLVSSEGGLASAQIAVPGQDCVYQLWSTLGEEHLRGLLAGLRFVAVRAGGSEGALAGVGY